MSVLVDKKHQVIVQGFTGTRALPREQMLEYGRKWWRRDPGKGGTQHLGLAGVRHRREASRKPAPTRP